MNILVACEESQEVCKAFRAKGHNAFSCDLLDCSGGHPEWHIKGDVLKLLTPWVIASEGAFMTKHILGFDFVTQDGLYHDVRGKWDMIIAFPPCTYLSNAGVCRLYPKKGLLDEERYKKGLEGKEFFLKFLNADCEKIAVENPVSSKVFQMPKHTQEVQPYLYDEFGIHPYTKKTRLWLKGLPPLVPTTPDEKPIGPYVPAGTGRKNRDKYGAAKRGEDAKNRAKTFKGLAKAMADQWG